MDKLGVVWIRCCESVQQVGKDAPTCGISAFGLRLLNEQVERVQQGFFVLYQLVNNRNQFQLPQSASGSHRVTAMAKASTKD